MTKELAPVDLDWYYTRMGMCGRLQLGAWPEQAAAAGSFLRFLARYARCCALPFSATVARRIYLCPGMGVGALSRYFGGVDNKSTTRQHARRGARGVLRHILIQMESNGLMETNNMETAEYVPTICVLYSCVFPAAQPATTWSSFASAGAPLLCLAYFTHLLHRGSKVTSGRTMTSKGRAEMDRVARSLAATE